MKLTPPPSPKAKPKSRENTSTQQSAKASFDTKKTATKRVILENVSYTGVDQHGQAEDTAFQKAEKKTNDTRNSVAVICQAKLSNEEEMELYNLGVLMAQMKWLRLFTDCEAFRTGVERGQGEVAKLGTQVDELSEVVLYKAKFASLDVQPKMVELNDLTQLYNFVGATGAELYRRGIMR